MSRPPAYPAVWMRPCRACGRLFPTERSHAQRCEPCIEAGRPCVLPRTTRAQRNAQRTREDDPQ